MEKTDTLEQSERVPAEKNKAKENIVEENLEIIKNQNCIKTIGISDIYTMNIDPDLDTMASNLSSNVKREVAKYIDVYNKKNVDILNQLPLVKSLRCQIAKYEKYAAAQNIEWTQ